MARFSATPDWSKLSVLDRFAAARHRALASAPYFAAGIYAFMPRPAPGLGTIGVSAGNALLYDEEVVGKWTPAQLAGALVHEVLHVVGNHHGRRSSRDPQLWNLAGDLWINPQVKAMGFELPEGGVFPAQFKYPENLTADQYYDLLQKDVKSGKIQVVAVATGLGAGKCGGCAGNPEDGEAEAAGGMARSEADLERVRVRVAEAVRKHAAERGRGHMPAGLLEWADFQLKPPKIRWEDELARVSRYAVAYRPGAMDYKHDRPSRRQAGVGFGPGRPVLSVLRAPIPQVAFVVDTSGSMGEEQLMEAANHGHAVIKATGAAVDYIACDAAVQVQTKVRDGREIARNFKGRGGTDFRPVFEALEKKRGGRPDVVVFVTDGMGPAPDRQPVGMRVIWVLVGPYACKPTPEWGYHIYTDDQKRDAQAQRR